MGLLDLVRLFLENAHETPNLVNLCSILKSGEFTPPPFDDNISMIFSNSPPGDDAFPSAKLMNHIVYGLFKQEIQLRRHTWNALIKFFDTADFADRCKCQIPLELLFILSKLDAEEAEKYLKRDRNSLLDEYFGEILGASVSTSPFNKIVLADVANTVVDIKTFLLQETILHVFYVAINDLFKCENRPQVDKEYLKDLIVKMTIYSTTLFEPFKGATVRDGILICMGRLVPDESPENVKNAHKAENVENAPHEAENMKNANAHHKADLYTISCHETAHFLVRSVVGNYNFSTPDKNFDCKRSEHLRFEKTDEKKLLELGRRVEMELFDGEQPRWKLCSVEAAKAFIDRAAEKPARPMPLIARHEYDKLVFACRDIPSFSFAADLGEWRSYWID